jgi:hypothetical protein
MSQENVEPVRRMLDAWNRRDDGAWLAADIESEPAGQLRGRVTAHAGKE